MPDSVTEADLARWEALAADTADVLDDYAIDLQHDVAMNDLRGLSRTAVPALVAEVRRLLDVKDGAYQERDQLVAALSKVFPASLERHPDTDIDWENDWRWIVFVDLPTGQATWHIHDSELSLFDHLKRDTRRKWDGHSTSEKYERLRAIPVQKEKTDG